MYKILLETAKVVTTATVSTGALVLYGVKTEVLRVGPIVKPSATTFGGRVVGGLKTVVKDAFKSDILKGVVVGGAAIILAYNIGRMKKVRGCVEDSVFRLKERVGLSPEAPSQTASKIVSESVRTGSVEQPTRISKFQAKVGAAKREFEVHGSAVRIENSLIVPKHVLCTAMDGDGFVWIRGTQGSIKLNFDNFDLMDTDLAVIELTEAQFSQIGLSMANLHERLQEKGDFVEVAGIAGKGTVGILRHDPTAFGKVIYEGTTLPGYSGAPYMKGNQMVGIHAWGGQVNGGYSASYVKTLIHHKLGKRFESSAEWLMEKFGMKAIKKSEIKFVGGSDEAWIRYQGQYHVVSGDEFRKAGGFKYLDDVFDDSESTRVAESLMGSGELRSLEKPGASGSSIQPGELESALTNVLIPTLSKLTKRQLSALGAIQQTTSSGSERNTIGLLSQPKQN